MALTSTSIPASAPRSWKRVKSSPRRPVSSSLGMPGTGPASMVVRQDPLPAEMPIRAATAFRRTGPSASVSIATSCPRGSAATVSTGPVKLISGVGDKRAQSSMISWRRPRSPGRCSSAKMASRSIRTV